MKVLLINGSSHKNGCTYTALEEVAKALTNDGIETEFIHIGSKAIKGCIGCNQCKPNECIFHDDLVNVVLEKMQKADGLVVGSPG